MLDLNIIKMIKVNVNQGSVIIKDRRLVNIVTWRGKLLFVTIFPPLYISSYVIILVKKSYVFILMILNNIIIVVLFIFVYAHYINIHNIHLHNIALVKPILFKFYKTTMSCQCAYFMVVIIVVIYARCIIVVTCCT